MGGERVGVAEGRWGCIGRAGREDLEPKSTICVYPVCRLSGKKKREGVSEGGERERVGREGPQRESWQGGLETREYYLCTSSV
jgi:hypothetical protein